MMWCPDFYKTGRYDPKAVEGTISNAMDVGDPKQFCSYSFISTINELKNFSQTYHRIPFPMYKPGEAMLELYFFFFFFFFFFLPNHGLCCGFPHGAVGIRFKKIPRTTSGYLRIF